MNLQRVLLLSLVVFSSSLPFAQHSVCSYIGESQKHFDAGDYEASIETLNKGVEFLNERNNKDSLSELYLKLGDSYKIKLQFKEAFNKYHEAERISTRIKDFEGLGKAYVAFIEYHRARRNFTKAKSYIFLMENLIEKHDISDPLLGDFYSRVAAIEMEGNGDVKKSLEYSFKVLEIAQKIKDTNLEGSAYNEIAFGYENSQKQSEALRYYKLALKAWQVDSNYRSITSLYTNLGRIESRLGHFQQAIDFYEKGLVLSDRYKYRGVKIIIYGDLHNLYLGQKKYEMAHKYLGNYFHALYEEDKVINEKMLFEIERKYDIQKQKSINKLAKKRTEIAKLETKNKTNEMAKWIVFSVLLASILVVALFFWVKSKQSNRLLKYTNEKLENSIDQKDAIFRELHHRIKNNLTMLKSILYLHGKFSSNEDLKRVLTDCQHRIDSMAAVHQNLYEVEDATRVEVKNFVRELIIKLEGALLPEGKKIRFSVEESETSLDISTAVFIGIIINELVTNSIKHAFDDEKELIIGVALERKEDFLTVKYWDNGQGLPIEYIYNEGGGFGFKLIEIMMRQLNTKLDYSVNKGFPTFSFTIKNNLK